MLNELKCLKMIDLCYIFDLSQLITDPTYVTEKVVDIILTNRKICVLTLKKFLLVLATATTRLQFLLKNYRSYKNFDIDKFNTEIHQINTPEDASKVEYVNEIYRRYENNFSKILKNML